ncbi:DUF4097 family beta strand repeat-containing protein [Alteromonas sp. CYL-A6]|uniref:DUF4097 family beta strand repeat-containing protein n=1 Tax=Alteromonas nitratireducens TaxID=3390813 RepID=UPI0034B2446D
MSAFKHTTGLLLLAGLLITPAALAKRIERSFSATPGDQLVIRTQVGSIDVETHNSDEILVDIRLEGDGEDDITVRFEEGSDGLTIIGERNDDAGWWNGNWTKAEFTVTVPAQYNVDVDTAGGSISVADLTGNIDARTSGGSIRVGNVTGDVDLQTSGGSIRTDDIYGEIDAHTSGGSINVTFARQPEQDATLKTSGGTIRARFPADVRMDLDASTSGGRVSTEFDIDGNVKKRSIRGRVNGGGPEITLRTSGGSVSVDKI